MRNTPLLLTTIFVSVLCISLLSSCTAQNSSEVPTQELTLSPAGALPDAPIVFVSSIDTSQIAFYDPVQDSVEYRSLGAVTDAGGLVEAVRLGWYIATDSENDIWVRIAPIYGNPDAGEPIEITTQGEVLRCENYPESLYRVSTIGGDSILGEIQNPDETYSVVEFDMRTCTYGEEILTWDTWIYEMMRSPNGMLAVWAISNTYGDEMTIFSPEGDLVTSIPGGQFPTWSHDGTRLTYSCSGHPEECFSPQLWEYDLSDSSAQRLFFLTVFGPGAISWSLDDSQMILGLSNGIFEYSFNGQPTVLYSQDTGSPVWR